MMLQLRQLSRHLREQLISHHVPTDLHTIPFPQCLSFQRKPHHPASPLYISNNHRVQELEGQDLVCGSVTEEKFFINWEGEGCVVDAVSV